MAGDGGFGVAAASDFSGFGVFGGCFADAVGHAVFAAGDAVGLGEGDEPAESGAGFDDGGDFGGDFGPGFADHEVFAPAAAGGDFAAFEVVGADVGGVPAVAQAFDLAVFDDGGVGRESTVALLQRPVSHAVNYIV